MAYSVNPDPVATDHLARTTARSVQPGDPDVPPAPGVSRGTVADAVVEVAAAAPSPTTRCVPRPVGLVRLAQVPPVGHVIGLVLGRYAADASPAGWSTTGCGRSRVP